MVSPEAAMIARTKLSPLGHQKLEVLAESGRQTPSFIKVHKYISRYLGYLSKDFFQEACLVPTHAACVSDFLQGKPDMPTFHQFRHEMWATGELWEINGTPHGSSQSFAQRTKVFADLWRHCRSCNVLRSCSALHCAVFVLHCIFQQCECRSNIADSQNHQQRTPTKLFLFIHTHKVCQHLSGDIFVTSAFLILEIESKNLLWNIIAKKNFHWNVYLGLCRFGGSSWCTRAITNLF